MLLKLKPTKLLTFGMEVIKSVSTAKTVIPRVKNEYTVLLPLWTDQLNNMIDLDWERELHVFIRSMLYVEIFKFR